jgi:hypothetical protein
LIRLKRKKNIMNVMTRMVTMMQTIAIIIAEPLVSVFEVAANGDGDDEKESEECDPGDEWSAEDSKAGSEDANAGIAIPVGNAMSDSEVKGVADIGLDLVTSGMTVLDADVPGAVEGADKGDGEVCW